MNIQSAIIEGTNLLKDKYIQTAKLDTEILMTKVIGKDRKYIFWNNNKNVYNKNLGYFQKLIKERASRKPIAYLINSKSFWNSEFFITNDVLIPRPDTELVIEEVLKITKHKNILMSGFHKMIKYFNTNDANNNKTNYNVLVPLDD